MQECWMLTLITRWTCFSASSGKNSPLPRKRIRCIRGSRIPFFRAFPCVYALLESCLIASPDTLFLFTFTVDCARDRTLLGNQRLLISDVTLSYSRLPSFMHVIVHAWPHGNLSETCIKTLSFSVNPLILLLNIYFDLCDYFTYYRISRTRIKEKI